MNEIGKKIIEQINFIDNSDMRCMEKISEITTLSNEFRQLLKIGGHGLSEQEKFIIAGSFSTSFYRRELENTDGKPNKT